MKMVKNISFTLKTVLFITIITQISAFGLQLTDDSCRDPTDLFGVCKHIKECPRLLSELMVSAKNDAFVQYIRQSNKKCGDVKFLVCCPHDDKLVPHFETVEPVDPNNRGRLLSIEEGCGFVNVTRHRIMGTKTTKRGAFPWLALIGYTNNLEDISWKCGGTLITTRHVLTAAHCVTPTLSVVRLGEHDISSTSDGVIRDINVIRSTPHLYYNQLDGTNDIAILYLEQDVDISLRIRPICLPVNEPLRSKSFAGYSSFTAGWGRFQDSGRPSNIPKEQQIQILDNWKCKERFYELGKLASENQFSDSVICAGSLTGTKDSCDIDSGGPLMQPSQISDGGYHAYYQIGIASYSIGCARTDTPAVYTRVQHFLDWIEENLPATSSKNRYNNDNYPF